MAIVDPSNALSMDSRALESIRQRAHGNPDAALKDAARQFEVLYMNTLLKSMREATPKDGLFDSEQSKLYNGMFDQQLAQTMAQRGMGLADMIVKQIERARGVATPDSEVLAKPSMALPMPLPAPLLSAGETTAVRDHETTGPNEWMEDILVGPAPLLKAESQLQLQNRTQNSPNLLNLPNLPNLPQPPQRPQNPQMPTAFRTDKVLSNLPIPPAALTKAPIVAAATGRARPGDPGDFVQRMWPHAVEASRMTGIPARFILGQAALESGWGKREIYGLDGKPSFNVFGIKAGGGWNGGVAKTMTLEYINGVPQKLSQDFRSYTSYADSFKDYARLLKDNPRYAAVLQNSSNAASFAVGMQRAGYATDPQYANKLVQVIGSQVLKAA